MSEARRWVWPLFAMAVSACGGRAVVADGAIVPPDTTPSRADSAPGLEGCGPPRVRCSGACVDPASDPQNCGSCGTRCDTTRGLACAAGKCRCTAPHSDCNGVCVDLSSDPQNCGGCGSTCPAGAPCTHGTCGPCACAPGLDCCQDLCVDLQTDPNNCGACGAKCCPGLTCVGGRCGGNCGPGQVSCGLLYWPNCSGLCTDLQSDSANCGSCEARCCPWVACLGGTCMPQCPAGQVPCGSFVEPGCSGVCTSLSSDLKNCGQCGKACGTNEICVSGQCII